MTKVPARRKRNLHAREVKGRLGKRWKRLNLRMQICPMTKILKTPRLLGKNQMLAIHHVAQSLSMNSVLPPLSVSLNIFWWKERHVRNSKCFFKAYPDVRHTFMFNTLCTYHGHKRTILTVIRVFYWYIDILFICFLLQAAMNSV